jgi:pimeloyl-ACP methyl ester carboxylesterase
MVLPVAVPPLLPFINNNNGGKAVTTASSSWNDDALTPPPVPIGVHSIQFTQSPPSTSTITAKYDGIYLHHGFGASSLSWLPILPTLVDRLGNGKARGIAHDAPGFGFTDRPDGDVSGGLQQYGTENNVGIGLALLKESLMDVDSMSSGVGGSGGGGSSAVEADETKSIAIFGHSMGCKAALLMALHCHVHKQFQLRPRLVVLVAPALEGESLPSNNGNGNKKKLSTSRTHGVSKGWLSKVWHRIWVTWRKLFLDYPFQYGLRRLVW